MKKFLALLLVALILLSLLLTSSASWEMSLKNFSSSTGNLERTITVTNMISGNVVWSYTGKCYISDSSTNGDVTIIYYRDDVAKKIDFIGSCFGIMAEEI